MTGLNLPLDWLEKILPAESVGIQYVRYTGSVGFKVKDRSAFDHYLRTVLGSRAPKLGQLRDEYTIEDLSELEANNTRLRKRVSELSPRLASLVASITVTATFAPWLGAGAKPVADGQTSILLNSGIKNFPVLMIEKERLDQLTPEGFEKRRTFLLQTFRSQGQPSWIAEQHERYFDAKFPRPTRDEFMQQASVTASAALQCLGLLPPIMGPLIGLRPSANDSRLPFFGDQLGVSQHASYLLHEVIEPWIYLHEVGHVALGHVEYLRSAQEDGYDDEEEHYEKLRGFEIQADAFATRWVCQLRVDFDTIRMALFNLFFLMMFHEVDPAYLPLQGGTWFLGYDSRSTEYSSFVQDWNNSRRTHMHSWLRFRSVWEHLGELQPPNHLHAIDVSSPPALFSPEWEENMRLLVSNPTEYNARVMGHNKVPISVDDASEEMKNAAGVCMFALENYPLRG